MPEKLTRVVSNEDLNDATIERVFERARLLKDGRAVGNIRGRKGTGLFCGPSLRTRLIVAQAMRDMGAEFYPIVAGRDVLQITAEDGVPMYGAAAEHARDLAGSLSRLNDIVLLQPGPRYDDYAAAAEDRIMNAFAEYSTIPVVNIGSAMWSPVAALADLFTICEEFHEPRKKKIAVVWTYHPGNLGMARANSVVDFAARWGLDIRIAAPERYDLDPDILKRAEDSLAKKSGTLDVYRSIDEAVAGADIVYAFSWTSKEFFGRLEAEKVAREKMKGWIVDEKCARLTSDARFMHSLPIRRNITATDAVIDAGTSLIYDQVENYYHVLKACLLEVLDAG